MIIDYYYRFHYVSNIIYKCRLFVKFLEAARIFQLILRKIILLREDFINKYIDGDIIIN